MKRCISALSAILGLTNAIFAKISMGKRASRAIADSGRTSPFLTRNVIDFRFLLPGQNMSALIVVALQRNHVLILPANFRKLRRKSRSPS